MTAACLLLPDVFGDDSSLFAAVNEEVGDRAQQAWSLFLVSAAWVNHLAFWLLSLVPGEG